MPIHNKIILSSLVAMSVGLTACSGDDGNTGPAGAQGPSGADGVQSLISQTAISAGNTQCFQGGVRIDSGVDADSNDVLDAGEISETSYLCNATQVNEAKNFNRIASFLVCSQAEATCNTDDETAAEIVAASTNGMTLIYTDSPAEQVGFVDITDPSAPLADGVVELSGEPTSVAVKGGYALVGVNTSADFVNVGGHLEVIDIAAQTSMREIDLGGQPDSVAVSPDGNYAAIVIENERDEDLGEGIPPQLPAGAFVIVDISDTDIANWSATTVDITGLSDLFPADPEPEYVDINENNIAVITLQENNHIILVDLSDGSIVNEFSAGAVDLENIDLTEGALQISQTESEDGVVREPDGVAWINNEYFATADEGDMDGGSRGFTVFNTAGDVVWNSAETLDHMAARFGHYPDKRSGNKGNEPENIEMGIFGDDRYLFVNSERSSLVFVYDIADPKKPVYKQTLPAAAGPEGGLAIPSRNLLVVASEEDNRGDKLRSAINIYQYDAVSASYPTIESTDRENGSPIPWAALSGLAADPLYDDVLYSIEDSFYVSNRIFTLRTNDEGPARIVNEIMINDNDDVFASFTAVDLADDTVDENDATRIDVFDEADLAAMINADKTVNIDPEGIAKAADGGFWVASEGSGTVGDADRPVNSLNFIFKTDAQGTIENVITLPSALNDVQLRFGFEGIAVDGDNVYVAMQRTWGADANPRIGAYDTVNESWEFFFYPLEAAASQNGGWVGLSDLTALGNGEFYVLERDNQGGPDAAIKRIYSIDVTGLTDGATLTKTLERDLMADLTSTGGLVAEKVEGLAVTTEGDVYIVNDNDGVDDNSGETRLINLGQFND